MHHLHFHRHGDPSLGEKKRLIMDKCVLFLKWLIKMASRCPVSIGASHRSCAEGNIASFKSNQHYGKDGPAYRAHCAGIVPLAPAYEAIRAVCACVWSL